MNHVKLYLAMTYSVCNLILDQWQSLPDFQSLHTDWVLKFDKTNCKLKITNKFFFSLLPEMFTLLVYKMPKLQNQTMDKYRFYKYATLTGNNIILARLIKEKWILHFDS